MTDLVGRVGWVSEQGHMLPRQHGTLSCVERDPLVDRNPEREKERERDTPGSFAGDSLKKWSVRLSHSCRGFPMGTGLPTCATTFVEVGGNSC